MRFKLKEWLIERIMAIREIVKMIFPKKTHRFIRSFSAGALTSLIFLFLVLSAILSKGIFIINFPELSFFLDLFKPVFFIASLYFDFHLDFQSSIFGRIILTFTLLLLSFVFSRFYIRKERINWRLILTIFIMSIIFFYGMLFINDYVGEKDMKFELKNHPNISEINCNGVRESKSIIANEMVTCDKVQDFSLSNFNVTFTLANGSKVEKYYNNSTEIKFIVPENLIKTEFILNGNLGNETKQLTGSLTTTYPTYAEFRENKNVFIQYAAILIAFLLVSVPTFMTKLKELIEGNEHKEKEKELKN